VRGIAAASLFLMGCLVTDKKEFPREPECAPSLETWTIAEPMTPLDQIVRVVDPGSGGEDGGVAEVPFEAKVRDCNLSQRLEWLAFLDRRPEFGVQSPFAGGDVPRADGERDRVIVARLNADLLTDGCHRVQIFVSGEFVNFPPGDPVTPGDLGIATWWVAVGSAVDMTTCR
jgi:hypothetical protein